MKRSTWIMTIIGILVVLGGGFFAYHASQGGNAQASQYDMHMNAGKDAVDAKNYDKAEDEFDKALEAKSGDKTAQAYKNQADNFSDIAEDVKENDYEEVINKLDQVINETNGYNVMITQAKKLKKTINKVVDNINKDIKPLLDQADAQEDAQNYAGAIATLDKILRLSYIKEDYYQKYYQEAKSEREEAVQKQKMQSSSSNTNSSTTSSSSSHSNSEGAQNSDKYINGQMITDAQVARARQQLNDLGQQAAAWSTLDVMKVLKISVENGHDSITMDDVNQFLKK